MPEPISQENEFYGILEDLKEFLPDLTLIGGWLPFIYVRFLWKEPRLRPVGTLDVDFAVGDTGAGPRDRTVYHRLSELRYSEHHLRLGRSFPVVMNRKGKVPVEFVTPPGLGGAAANLLGRELLINEIDGTDFLLAHRVPVSVRRGARTLEVLCPVPSAFLYHKVATFHQRHDPLKRAKDLTYAYFILRHGPDPDRLLREIRGYPGEGVLACERKLLKSYFERRTSEGCLMVEKENGPDPVIQDLREDIRQRFAGLMKALPR